VTTFGPVGYELFNSTDVYDAWYQAAVVNAAE
jgi:hypothetical protein